MFWDLHCAIQAAMGWTNSHLHGFYLSNKKSHSARPIIMPMPYLDGPAALPEDHEYLADWFPTRIKQCLYTYDFGDTWDHTVLFERALPGSQKHYPHCVAGANACPPDDCGGPGGYIELPETIRDPITAEDKHRRDWMGLAEDEMYDPTLFSPKNIKFADPNKFLKEYLLYAE